MFFDGVSISDVIEIGSVKLQFQQDITTHTETCFPPNQSVPHYTQMPMIALAPPNSTIAEQDLAVGNSTLFSCHTNQIVMSETQQDLISVPKNGSVICKQRHLSGSTKPYARSSNQKIIKVDKNIPSNDPFQRPPYSYATLIADAILNSPQKKLTLSEIYKGISDTYPYFQYNGGAWQVS